MYRTVEEHLFAEGYAFDFFQAVRLLEKLAPERRPIGREGPPGKEIVRFRNHQSLSFPPSAIYEVEKPTPELAVPAMTVTFMGLTGATGVLPRHYTEMLLRQKDIKTPERFAARDWFDLFNHRILSLFYRAWEKYRFYLLYERGEFAKDAPDPFTRALYSFVGLETRGLRKRLRVEVCEPAELAEDAHSFARIGGLTSPAYPENRLAGIDDFALVFYGGFLSHRPRSAINLEAMLRDYFQLPLTVEQFHGQWLQLEIDNQSSLAGPNNALGVNTVAGDRVWDVQSKFRVRLGPLRYNQFQDFLPDPSPAPERKAFYLLSHLTRFYAGDEFDFDVQLVLEKEDVPPLQLTTDAGMGPRLGWNTWIYSQAMEHDAEDAVFPGQDMVFINRN